MSISYNEKKVFVSLEAIYLYTLVIDSYMCMMDSLCVLELSNINDDNMQLVILSNLLISM